MTNLENILKSRDVTLPTKVHLVKAMGFPVVRYGCDSWTIKKAECQRTDAFELWCWRRLLRVLWTARRSNQSILKEISEAPIVWPPDAKNQLIEKDPDDGKDWRQEEKGAREDEWLDGITDSMDMSWSKLWEMVTVLLPWGHNESDTNEWLSNKQTRDSLMLMAKTLYSQHRGSDSVRKLYLTCHN